jgi:hypothetical protein
MLDFQVSSATCGNSFMFEVNQLMVTWTPPANSRAGTPMKSSQGYRGATTAKRIRHPNGLIKSMRFDPNA